MPAHPHVVSHVPTVDVLAVNIRIKLLLVLLEPSKPLVTVRNVKTTIQSSLEGTKDTVSSGCPNEANIQESTERPPFISWFNIVVLPSGLTKGIIHIKIKISMSMSI